MMISGLAYRGLGLSLLLVMGSVPANAQANAYDQAIGYVMAAQKIAASCDGLRGRGDDGSTGFVFAASDLLATQGLRRQKLRRLLFYAKTDGLLLLGDRALSARGLDPFDTDGLCRFGRKMAATNDSIGRFLIVEP